MSQEEVCDLLQAAPFQNILPRYCDYSLVYGMDYVINLFRMNIGRLSRKGRSWKPSRRNWKTSTPPFKLWRISISWDQPNRHWLPEKEIYWRGSDSAADFPSLKWFWTASAPSWTILFGQGRLLLMASWLLTNVQSSIACGQLCSSSTAFRLAKMSSQSSSFLGKDYTGPDALWPFC